MARHHLDDGHALSTFQQTTPGRDLNQLHSISGDGRRGAGCECGYSGPGTLCDRCKRRPFQSIRSPGHGSD